MSEIHKLQQMLDNLIERDKERLEQINSYFGAGMTLENRLILANERVVDALSAVSILARYIMEKEGEPK